MFYSNNVNLIRRIIIMMINIMRITKKKKKLKSKTFCIPISRFFKRKYACYESNVTMQTN